MRALPPRTNRTADNKLAVLQEPGPTVKLNGVAVREQQDADTVRAADWLQPLRLDVDELRARRDGDVEIMGWEMKFVSGVLLGVVFGCVWVLGTLDGVLPVSLGGTRGEDGGEGFMSDDSDDSDDLM